MKLRQIIATALATFLVVISLSFLPQTRRIVAKPTLAQVPPESLVSSENGDIAAPFFREIKPYQTRIEANGDRADIYYPDLSQITNRDRLPIALILQGYNVHKTYYSAYATHLARYGFIVVVPNHVTAVRGKLELFAQVEQVPEVLQQMKWENNRDNSPLYATIDSSKMVVIGHSHGGFMGMDAIREACDMPFCEGDYRRPPELLGGVFFGADLWEDGEYLTIDNSTIPIALIAGNRDSLVRADSIKITYDNIQTPPKAFITVIGANHYGITDVDNPAGSPLEKNPPTLPQEVAIETIARWSAMFLRAYTLDDPAALEYLQFQGDSVDENVTLIYQDVPSFPPATENENSIPRFDIDF
jgi:predicted dienelactone hydrolase